MIGQIYHRDVYQNEVDGAKLKVTYFLSNEKFQIVLHKFLPWSFCVARNINRYINSHRTQIWILFNLYHSKTRNNRNIILNDDNVNKINNNNIWHYDLCDTLFVQTNNNCVTVIEINLKNNTFKHFYSNTFGALYLVSFEMEIVPI